MVRQAIGLQSKGIKELTAQLRAMKDVGQSQKVAMMLGDAADIYRKQAIGNMRSQRWPHETQEAAFVDRRWPQARRGKNKISVLFGLRKRGRSQPWAPGYVEWHGKDKGRLVGMSLATLFEFGGRKIAARPAMIPALVQTKPQMRTLIKTKLKEIVTQAQQQVNAPVGGTNG